MRLKKSPHSSTSTIAWINSAFFLNVIFLQWGGGTLGTYIIALVGY